MSDQDKFSHLLATKEEKINALNEKSFTPTYADESLSKGTYTDTGDDYVESNINKLWGIGEDWTPQELAFARDYVYQNYALPDESRQDRRFYEYGLKDKGSIIDPEQSYQSDIYDPTKLGLASGRFDSADYRYQPGRAKEEGLIRPNKEYGWSSGTAGVDVSKKYQDVNLEANAATALEALTHTNRRNLENRLVRQRSDGMYDYASPEGMVVIDKAQKDALFGSGASEYYVNRKAIFDENYDPAAIDQEKIIKGINEAIGRVSEKSYYPAASTGVSDAKLGELADKHTSGISRAINTASGFASGFVDSLIISPLDAIGDLTGIYDIGTNEEKSKMVNNWFGYNDQFAARSMERVGKQLEVVADENASITDKMRAIASGVIEAALTPELLGTSLGVLASWMTPGIVLKALGKGAKLGEAIDKIDKAVKAGEITKKAALGQKVKTALSNDGVKAALVNQSGHLVSAMGAVNNQYEDFVKNNNGVELSGADKAKWFSTRFMVQVVNQNVDKFMDVKLMKSPGMIAATIPAIKAMSNKEFANVAKTVGKGIAVTTAGAGSEAAQEYTQTMMELFNSRYGSKVFEDKDSFVKFITDERNTTEAGIAALAGAGGALQFQALGSVLPATKGIASGIGKVSGAFTGDGESSENASNIGSTEQKLETARVVQRNVERIARASTPTGSYYSAMGSDNAEARATASQSAKEAGDSILDGTNTIFNSDAEFDEKLQQIKPLIEIAAAENPNIGLTRFLEVLLEKLKPVDEESKTKIEETVNTAYEEGLRFNSIKSLAEVSEEASVGARGFITYYTNAKAALAEGDVKAYEESLTKLDGFFSYEHGKYKRITSAISTIEGNINSSVDRLVKQGKAKSRKDALRILTDKYVAENPVVTINNSDNPNPETTSIAYSDVAMRMANNKYSKGIYRLLGNLENEVSQMDKLQRSLIAELSGDTSNVTPSNINVTDTTTVDTNTPSTNVAPSNITSLNEGEVFVFGSNEKGIHGKGAAKTAMQWGAQKGQAEGLQGSTYAIPTKSNPNTSLKIEDVKSYVDNFIKYATEHPELTFLVTEIGTGLAGFSAEEIAPLFADATGVNNIRLPANFLNVLNKDQQADIDIPSQSDIDVDTFSVPDEELGTFDIPTEESVEFDVPEEVTFDERFNIPEETLSDEGFDSFDTFDERFDEVEGTAEKDTSVKVFNENRKALKDIKKQISERRAQLRAVGIRGKEALTDPDLIALFEKKQDLDNTKESFVSVLKDKVAGRINKIKKFKDSPFTLYTNYSAGEKAVKSTVTKLFSKFKPTGYTIADRTKNTATASTKKFADNLLKALNIKDGEFDVNYGKSVESNPLAFLLFDEEGKLNYNVVEATQSAAYEFLVQEASNLLGSSRTDEEVAELLGIPEEYVTLEMRNALANGGITLKLAAESVGTKIIKNLGLEIKSIQDKEALATAFGIMALQGLEEDYITNYDYVPSVEESTRKNYPIKKASIPIIKGTPELFDKLKSVRSTIQYFEDTLGVDIDKERTYSTQPPAKSRTVNIHRTEYQEAPKDHQDVVNRLENTSFSFNSGNDVLLEMFSEAEGVLDTQALVDLILGKSDSITNKDGMDRYKAQKEALERSIKFYQEAKEDVKEGNLFFKWFIAKNHRIHLDSNRINPQNDKHLSRWLLTASNSVKNIAKSDIEAVVNGQEGSMEAKMFAYAIVQAFDGNKVLPGTEGKFPGIDKDNEAEVLAAAKVLLENTPESALMEMAMKSAHIGHAALAIANIRKFADASDSFDSDMVLEVDGLTNGFAFRAMQFPVQTDTSSFTPTMWLEKVGVIPEGSLLFDLDSMNGARNKGQEDVYISVGQTFNQEIAKAKNNLSGVNKKWVSLFEKHKKLPDFSDTTNGDVKSFIRNLMKSPVMIFNYAAGIGKIANGLVTDQIMGTNYLSGRGLIDLLTEKENGNYVVSFEELQNTFGKNLGERYHKARVELHKKSLADLRNPDIVLLKSDMHKAISGLYVDPLKTTLETLFAKQTAVNTVFTNAAQFMFDYFKEQYDLWRLSNPEADEEQKIEFLKDIAAIVPGVAGASTDDQLNKITFLKSVLEDTNNDVKVYIRGKKMSANTVSRGYGDPGVGPAVLTVLSLDSSVLAKTINEAYKGKKGAALPIHDAIVLGISESSTIKSYNRNFYTANRGYSISQEFVNAIENFEKSVSDANLRSIVTITGDTLSFNNMKTALLNINDEVQSGRKEIFSNNVKIGQLVGPEGTMDYVNVKEAKELSEKYLANVANMISDKLAQDNVKNALGKDYDKVLARINKMLEGCK